MKLKYAFLIVVGLVMAGWMSAQRKPTVFLIGDSTVRNGQGIGSDGLWGWGAALPLYFDLEKVNVENWAMGGMSSRTYYYSETLWKKVLDSLKPGDYVIMQLGHNDGNPLTGFTAGMASIKGIGEDTVHVNVRGKEEVVHTYGWYMRQYIRETKAKGAIPIMCSLIPRNDWDSEHQMKAEGPYAQYAKDVAAQEKIAFIDLNARARKALEAEGQSVVTGKYYLTSDHTHTIAAGAMLNASLVAEGIRAIPNCGLIPFLLDKPSGTFPIKKKLFIIGDSTVANGTPPLAGWGKPIREMFDTARLMVINRAIGGRSSHSYMTEGTWDKVLEEVQPGDFILMGFGHNDGNPMAGGAISAGYSEDTIHLNRMGRTQVFHTFGWYMTKYVRDAKAKGAIPILFSQVAWRELPSKKTAFTPYFKQIAEAENVSFIPLNDMVAEKYAALGQEKVNTLFERDHTHTNLEGAILNAQTVIEGIKALRNCPLRGYLPVPGLTPAPSGAPAPAMAPASTSGPRATAPAR